MIDYEKSNSNSYWKKNEYRIQIDVENDATEDEIWDALKEAYLEDDYNNVDSYYDITIIKIVGE